MGNITVNRVIVGMRKNWVTIYRNLTIIISAIIIVIINNMIMKKIPTGEKIIKIINSQSNSITKGEFESFWINN